MYKKFHFAISFKSTLYLQHPDIFKEVKLKNILQAFLPLKYITIALMDEEIHISKKVLLSERVFKS